ncbi:hypothetical protein ANN_23648 [Periplaneta americana]|uniref:BESS domain-containing protein n=1 Tax=Periplaneta americana TaxID=6978 RepID=A0ABQ8SLN5_PERAM|nr:hypothetical protein ANN_23648 [Periplaneta americana]
MLGRRVKNRRPRPEELQELRRALGEEWELIPQENIANQIESMPRCMDVVIQARGECLQLVSSLDVTPSTSVEATSEAIHLSDDASTSTESPAPMQESSLGGSFQEEFRPKRANLQDTLSKVADSFTSFVATRESSGPSDLNFMKSVLEDMKMIPHKDKFKFKNEVLDLLEKYIP